MNCKSLFQPLTLPHLLVRIYTVPLLIHVCADEHASDSSAAQQNEGQNEEASDENDLEEASDENEGKRAVSPRTLTDLFPEHVN